MENLTEEERQILRSLVEARLAELASYQRHYFSNPEELELKLRSLLEKL
jgi:hypothetical protein